MNHGNFETSNYRADMFVRDHLDQEICSEDERKLRSRKINSLPHIFMQLTKPGLETDTMNCSFQSLSLSTQRPGLSALAEQLRLG